MKSKKRLILWLLYGAVMLAFAVWLACSNSWVAAANSETTLKKVSFADYPGRAYVFMTTQSSTVTAPFTERLSFRGIYVPATGVSPESAQMALLLVNGQDCYELSVEPDESEMMAITSDNMAFNCDVSLLPVKTGMYDLYFYCYGNEERHGATYTGYQVRKTYSGVEVYPWAGTKTEARQQPTQKKTLGGGIDQIFVRYDSTQIRGWAGLEGQDNTVQAAWVELTDAAGQTVQYTARQVLRQDVGYVYGENYTRSGFYTNFPTDDLADGVYTVRVLLEQGGEIRPTTEYTLAVYNKNATFERGIIRPMEWTPAALQELGGGAYVHNAIESGVTLDQTVQFCNLTGYAITVTDGDESGRQISLVLDGDAGCYQVPAKLIARPDVTAAFPTAGVENENVGFNATLFTGDVPDGDYKLYIYDRENETDAGLVDTYYRVNVSAKGLLFTRFASEVPNETLQVTAGTPATGGVDAVKRQGDCVNIAGWVSMKGISSENQRVLLELTGPDGTTVQYTTEQILRADVATVYDDMYKMNGFFTNIPAAELPDGEYTMRVLVQNGETIQASVSYWLTISGETVTKSAQ